MPDREGPPGPDIQGGAADGDRARRLDSVLRASGLNPAGPPSEIESHSNDTYLIDDPMHGASVLRICYRGDIDRLPREAAIGRHLPPEVGYPEILALGEGSANNWGLTWSLSRQLRGTTLLDAWPGLSRAERRRAARSASDALRALHAWRPPQALVASLAWPFTPALTTPELVIGASIHPVPIERTGLLVDALMARDGVDVAMVGAARNEIERLGHLAPVVDDPSTSGLIHGDLHLSNIWWSDRGQAGLIDLEWARFAPAWMELARIRENADADEAGGLDAHVEFMGWLEVDDPELFAIDRLGDRIRLLCLVFQVRQSLIWPAPAPGPDMVADHPLRMLQRLLQTPNLAP